MTTANDTDALNQEYNALLERLSEEHNVTIEVTREGEEYIAGAYLHNGTYGLESYPYSTRRAAITKADELRGKWIGIMLRREAERGTSACVNCSEENERSGYIELWDGVCPDCGRVVDQEARDNAP